MVTHLVSPCLTYVISQSFLEQENNDKKPPYKIWWLFVVQKLLATSEPFFKLYQYLTYARPTMLASYGYKQQY
ncbi:hypothetical protein QN360_13715, partial [Glaciimonas sp. CA11.2]|uniref:hypothetical protein n=1 Tax=Glaciimonas sp. CA11.2 TaxID=3048601 RepID=UPI002B22B303